MMGDFDARTALAARLRGGGPIFDDEWDFIAGCVERAPPLCAREVTRLRDWCIADFVTIMHVVSRGKKEAAIAAAMKSFGVARSQVHSALKRYATEVVELRKELEKAASGF
jgi:hypothetical protein